jgi:hypothetical protein
LHQVDGSVALAGRRGSSARIGCFVHFDVPSAFRCETYRQSTHLGLDLRSGGTRSTQPGE